jgi:hypothetical protein
MPSIVKKEADLREKIDGQRSYDVKGLWASHLEIIRLYACGLTEVAISRQLGISSQTVCNVLGSDLAKERLLQIVEKRDEDASKISEQLKELFPLARETLKSTMLEFVNMPVGADKDVRSQAVRSAIALTDHVHPKTVRQEGLVGHLTLDQIERMKRDARVDNSIEASIVEVTTVEEA